MIEELMKNKIEKKLDKEYGLYQMRLFHECWKTAKNSNLISPMSIDDVAIALFDKRCSHIYYWKDKEREKIRKHAEELNNKAKEMVKG